MDTCAQHTVLCSVYLRMKHSVLEDMIGTAVNCQELANVV